MRLAANMAVASDAGKAGHPRHLSDREGVTHAHEVRSMRTEADAPYGESGEARAVSGHHVVVLDRDGFRLRRAVDIDELRQQIARLVFGEEASCLVRSHFIHLQRAMRYRYGPASCLPFSSVPECC